MEKEIGMRLTPILTVSHVNTFNYIIRKMLSEPRASKSSVSQIQLPMRSYELIATPIDDL